MKFLKNNLKVIIAFIVGVILAGGIVYAATSAKDVTYTTSKNGEIKNVEEALNDLYGTLSENNNKFITSFRVENSSSTTSSATFLFVDDILKYKYFKIISATPNSNVKTTSIKGWSNTNSKKVALEINKEYKVQGKDDDLDLASIYAEVQSSNGSNAVYSLNIEFYN